MPGIIIRLMDIRNAEALTGRTSERTPDTRSGDSFNSSIVAGLSLLMSLRNTFIGVVGSECTDASWSTSKAMSVLNPASLKPSSKPPGPQKRLKRCKSDFDRGFLIRVGATTRSRFDFSTHRNKKFPPI